MNLHPETPESRGATRTLIMCESMTELQEYMTHDQVNVILATILQQATDYSKHLVALNDGTGRILALAFLDPDRAQEVPADYVDPEVRRWLLSNWIYDSDEPQPPAPVEVAAPPPAPVEVAAPPPVQVEVTAPPPAQVEVAPPEPVAMLPLADFMMQSKW